MVEMKKIVFTALTLLFALASCRHPEIQYVDFHNSSTFHPYSVKSADVAMPDGSLNPEVVLLDDGSEDTKIASTPLTSMARDLLGVINCNRLIHIAGTFEGHDVDGTPLVQSGKLLLPAEGPVKNIILVSHFTIGANSECPSEAFPLEGIVASKGYAVAIADYIGYGVTANRIHPYMHTESTARSVVDMGLAVLPFLEEIGRKPESDEIILMGYSQGGSTTMAVLDLIQDEYHDTFKVKQVYCGGGPYDLAATFDVSMELDQTGIPSAIPMIVQGINEGEHLGLEMKDFFQERLLNNYQEWINSKKYPVKEINKLIGSSALHEIMTPEGRDKNSPKTARLYKALLLNSTLYFIPHAPVYMLHSTVDQTVPFQNALSAKAWFKGCDIHYDFDDYGKHGTACLKFIMKVASMLP